MRPGRRSIAELRRDYLPIVTVLVALVAGVRLLTSSEPPQRAGPRARMIGTVPNSSSALPAPADNALGHRVSSLTLVLLAVFAACLWINAGINVYRFNFAIAVLGALPLAFALLRARVIRTQG